MQSATQELAGELVKEVMMADADDANLLGTHYVFLDGTKPQSAPAPRQRFNEAAVPEGPYKGKPHAIPGVIELVDFDHGGEGVAYHDSAPTTSMGSTDHVKGWTSKPVRRADRSSGSKMVNGCATPLRLRPQARTNW